MRFLWGCALGVVTSLLWAPAPGRETRRVMRDRLRHLGELPHRQAVRVAEDAKQKAGDLGSKVGRKAAESAVEAMEDDLLGREKAS